MREIKKIAVPLDFQQHTDLLVEYAIYVANSFGASARFIHALEPLAIYPDDLGESLSQFEKKRLYRAKQQMLDLVDNSKKKLHSEDCKGWAVHGDTVNTILEYVERVQADLIVIATHGRRGLGKILMGSVADRVLKHAPCPVLLLNPFNKKD